MRAVWFLPLCALAAQAQRPAYDQPYRPQFHFSPQKNWTNDPNGLVYFGGEYHLFFQYNPFGDQWGHMTWGHAVSRDLIRWQELPPAIPEENGVMIFTGSTVVDERNTSGFCAGGQPCLVAVYTGHEPARKRQTQHLAYSNDRGRTWTKYAGNPVLDLNMADFRDPKVLWFAPGGRWIMVVALPNEHKVHFYASADLKKWDLLSEFGPAGAAGGQWECPELFALPVDGKSSPMRWVLKIGLNPGALQGGSGEQYFVGRFDGTRFVNDNPPSATLWTDYGKDCYCGLTFNNRPPVMIGWMSNWQYAGRLPTAPWRGQMTVPRILSLRTTPEGIRLFQWPVEGLPRGARATGLADVTATIPLGTAQEAGLKLMGGSVTVGYDRAAQELFVERPAAPFHPAFGGRVRAPLRLGLSPTLRLRVLVDRSSVEVFAGEGRVTMTQLVFAPPGGRLADWYATGGKPGRVSLKVQSLESIW